MPIIVDWNDKSKAFIKCRLQDPWTLEEFIEARKSWYRMIKSVDHRVPILLDLRATHEPPKGALRQFCAMQRAPHPRQGHIYLKGLNPAYEILSPHFSAAAVDPDKKLRIIEADDESIISP